jgi:excisionase family DNA binding protein
MEVTAVGEELVLTLPEMAVALKIKKSTAYALAKSGKLPFPILRLNRSIRIPISALRAWIDQPADETNCK